MTELLIRIFVKDYQNTGDRLVRAKYGHLAGVTGIVCNVILCGFKIFIGWLVGSMAIAADGLNNLSDAASNIITMIGFKLGSRPGDKEHPYGHGRYEYLAAIMIVVMIMAVGLDLIKESITKILHPEPVEFRLVMVVVLAGSILIKIWMMFFNKKMGDRIDSDTLRATAADSRNDAIATSAVLLAMIIGEIFHVNVDGWLTFGVAVFIIINGILLFKETLDPLLGKAPDEALVRKIQDKILSYEGVLGTHDLLVHDYGPGRLFATAHVEMDGGVDPLTSHEVIDRMEEDFINDMQVNLLVHYDPVAPEHTKEGAIRSNISEFVEKLHADIRIHDLRIRPGEDCEILYFDCVVPEDFSMPEEELKSRIQIHLNRYYPQYYCNITIDRGFDAMPKES